MNKIIKNTALYFLGNDLYLKFRFEKIKRDMPLTILNLHRVMDGDTSSYQPLKIKLFEELLNYVKKHYLLISFDDLNNLNQNDLRKPPLILSFDDGYKDFFEYAMPILDKHKIRVNQNIIPYCVESGLPPLNVLIQDFIGNAPMSLLQNFSIPGFVYDGDKSNRILFGLSASKFIKNKSFSEQAVLQGDITSQIFNFIEFKPTKMMNLNDIKETTSYHEIGAHSFSHSSMFYESDEYVQNDAINCKIWFSSFLNIDASIYTFPNGSYKPHQLNIVKNNGYKYLLLVSDKFSYPTNTIHDRFGFHADSYAELKFRTLGGLNKTNRTTA